MSDQVTVGEYSLEISGDEVLVRDESGAIVESVDLDEVDGEITLPDGQKIDLAAVLADKGIENFETAAGPANENVGAVTGGPTSFRPLIGVDDPASSIGSAGALGGTSLKYGLIDSDPETTETPDTLLARSSFDWAQHEPPASGGTGSVGNGGQHNNSGGNQSNDDDDDGDTVTPPSNELPPHDNDNASGPDEQQNEEPSTPPADEQDQSEDEDEQPSTPPTDEQQPEDEGQDEEPQPQVVNAAPTGIDLASATVVENTSGAVVGALTVVDPDDGDAHSFAVSDDRFEVVDGQLKLRDGISLDFEATPSLDVVVTATDKAGNQVYETFSIAVGDVNEAQTSLALGNGHVTENAVGAVVGTIFVADPDAGDIQSLQVSDSRFEVVDNALKLKDGVSLDFEIEPSIEVTVTATDAGGHTIEKDFTINVDNVNEAPVVAVQNGSFSNQIVDVNIDYAPVASATVGAYLYSNDKAGVTVPNSSLLNGVAASNMTLSAPTEVVVTFQKEAAGNHNMIGAYQYDDAGNIIPGTIQFVWLDATASNEGKLGANLSKDFLGYAQSSSISLGEMAEGTHVGFFAISNGASNGANQALLKNAAAGATNQADAMDAIAGQLSIQVDGNGNAHVYVGNSQLSGDTFFTHDKSMNTDFNAGKDIDHMASGVSSSLPGQLLIGVEDLNGGGDKDYNDVVFSVDLGTYNVNKMTQSGLQPSVDFSDVDSDTLSQAVIQTSGFQIGDTLNVPPSGLFDVSVTHQGADLTITIVGKTGNETVDQYEAFANSIYFSSNSKVEGDRHIDYSVADDGGLHSNISTADITLSNQYELSTSELGKGQTTLGSGDDVLYINTDSFSPVHMGDGDDTVHLAQQGRSFGHQDAIKLEGVETIDATGYGANNVSLSIHDVLNMTDNDNRLTIVGEQGDTVTLTNSGNSQWTVVESNAEFTTYSYSDPSMQAVVEISNQLNTQVS